MNQKQHKFQISSFLSDSLWLFTPPRRRMAAKLKKKREELLADLIQFENAFYHPDTRQKLMIQDGCCAKIECKHHKSFGVKKVLLPLNCMSQSREEIPLERIGKIVVCFLHFCHEDQKEYFNTGSFREDVLLTGPGGNSAALLKEKKAPEQKGKKGFRLSDKARNKDNDWVCNFIFYSQKHFSLYQHQSSSIGKAKHEKQFPIHKVKQIIKQSFHFSGQVSGFPPPCQRQRRRWCSR
jgi:hypothetical protein